MVASEAQIAATARYNKRVYEQIAFKVRRDSEINADIIKTHATSRGESTNGFILRAIREAIERDNVKIKN